MARGVNKVILIGNLGGDPEVRYMPNGNAVANITLATSESWKDKQSGQVQEKTEWHRVVFFGRIAEVVGEYARKGSKLYIEGKLQTREWEKDGIKRYTTEVVVDMGGQMQLLDAPQGNQQQRPQQQQPQGGNMQQQRPQQQPQGGNMQQQRPQQQPQGGNMQQQQPAQQSNYNQQNGNYQQNNGNNQPQNNYDQSSGQDGGFGHFHDDIPFRKEVSSYVI